MELIVKRTSTIINIGRMKSIETTVDVTYPVHEMSCEEMLYMIAGKASSEPDVTVTWSLGRKYLMILRDRGKVYEVYSIEEIIPGKFSMVDKRMYDDEVHQRIYKLVESMVEKG